MMRRLVVLLAVSLAVGCAKKEPTVEEEELPSGRRDAGSPVDAGGDPNAPNNPGSDGGTAVVILPMDGTSDGGQAFTIKGWVEFSGPAGANTISAVRDVTAYYEVSGGTLPSSAVTLEFFTPGGLTYQTDQADFPSTEPRRVSTSTPVAGSNIQQGQMSGNWSVRMRTSTGAVYEQKFTLNR